MILINKNSTSTYYFTLTENVTLTSPYFLFEFTNDFTQTPVYFIAANTSSYSYRYDSFVITETSGTNILTSGTITLSPAGQWTYRVFEQTSSTNLNPANATTLLETGIVKVVGTSDTYYENQVTNTFIIDE